VPAYDYRCERGHRYERREPFGSPKTHDCEKCGEPANRVLAAPAIAFKGSGWYKTDSRGSEPRGHDKEKSKSGLGSSSSGDSSSGSGSSNGSSADAGKATKDSKTSKNGKASKNGKSAGSSAAGKSKKAGAVKAD
jgi:putative FmdB family regulatory protein